MTIQSIEIVEDRTQKSRCDVGFLNLKRLMVRNVHAGGACSAPYPCDIVSRPNPDAAAIILYEVDGGKKVYVILKRGLRPPVFFRRNKELVQPDRRPYLHLVEMIAGVLEKDDRGPQGIFRRAAAEAKEEAGFAVPFSSVTSLGAELFASPGVTDEKIFFCAAPVQREEGHIPEGDGSLMEEGTEVVILELREAIAMCRRGDIPDMKTEVALLRLADAIGYLPQVGCFRSELPRPLSEAYDDLGVKG